MSDRYVTTCGAVIAGRQYRTGQHVDAHLVRPHHLESGVVAVAVAGELDGTGPAGDPPPDPDTTEPAADPSGDRSTTDPDHDDEGDDDDG